MCGVASAQTVQTVRGPVEVDELGTTLMHEHVFVLTADVMQNYGHEWWDEEERVADAITKLRALKDAGVDTLVDCTVVGLGRYIPRVARINAEVDLHIVAATGYYTYDELPPFFQVRGGPGTLLGGPELLTEMFVRDITEGIGGTGIRAAFLKCRRGEGYTPDQTRVHRAICDAHRQTGVPITVHTMPRTRPGGWRWSCMPRRVSTRPRWSSGMPGTATIWTT